MPVACLSIPHFSIRVALAAAAEAKAKAAAASATTTNDSGHASPDHFHYDGRTPIILRDPERTDTVVIDANAEAARHGIRPGQHLREATALSPLAVIVTRDPVAETQRADSILKRLLAISPLVEADEHDPGCWYIDLIGLERYYGSLEGAARAIHRCVPAGVNPRIAIAPTRFAARVVAGRAETPETRILDEAQAQAFLATASVTWLPLDPGLIRQFQKLGLSTLGTLAQFDDRKLFARFGKPGRTAWELANGIDRRPVMATRLPLTITEAASFTNPTSSLPVVMAWLHHLVTRAFRRPDLRDRFVGKVILHAMLERGGSWTRTLVLKTPSGAEQLMQSLRLRLQSLEVSAPIEPIAIILTDIMPEAARQQILPALRQRTDGHLQGVVTQLAQRYGISPLYRIVEVEPWSRIPERRHALLVFDP
jgi:nucleotidyltransferase/DNA polymerase involved in DNA repair